VSGVPKPPDPFKVLRESYEQATEAWAQAVEQAISTEEFAASAGKVMERYTEMQEVLRKTSEAVAEQLHIPTKDDIARVAQLVINVERKVDDVSDQADALGRRDPAEAVAGLAERLATIEERIAGIAARLDAVDRIESRLGELATARAAAEPTPPAAKPRAPAPPPVAPPQKPAPARPRAKAAEGGAPATPARRRSTRPTAKEE
jgi:polyhydroxyalkanoic acid synthase PhaR subunit